MRLFKVVSKRHDPRKEGATLQLGSLDYYREIEDPARRDELEGVYEIDVEAETLLSRRAAGRLFHLFSFENDGSKDPLFGNFVTTPGRLKLEQAGVRLLGGTKIRYAAAKTFIFSMSRSGREATRHEIPGTVKWFVKKGMEDRFFRDLFAEVVRSFGPNFYYPYLSESVSWREYSQPPFLTRHAQVTYEPRTLTVPGASIDEEFCERLVWNLSPFRKDTSFGDEREYRLAIVMRTRHAPMFPEHVRLLSAPFLKYMEFR